MRALSKEEVLKLAARPQGAGVHVYKWSHAQRLKQLTRYYKAGLLTRKRIGDIIVFKLKGSDK